MSLTTIFALLTHYGYFLLFPVAVVEGPIVSVIAGFLASLGYLNLYLVYLVVVAGDLVGDALCYAIGRWGQKKILKRWGHYIGLGPERLENMRAHFRVHTGKTIFFGKWSHSVSFAFLMAAGAAEVPLVSFLWFCLLATVPKSLILVLVGYFFGHAYNSINSYIEWISITLLTIIAVFIVWYFKRKK